jgi:hypothetical protein
MSLISTIFLLFLRMNRVMRCSLNVIPQTKDLLNKCRLPLGLMIHPFKDLDVWKLSSSYLISALMLFISFRVSVLFKVEKLFDVINVRVISIHSSHSWTILDGVVVFVLEQIIVMFISHLIS